MTAATLLLRQVHPNFVQNGFASSIAFRPNDTDNGLMVPVVRDCDSGGDLQRYHLPTGD